MRHLTSIKLVIAGLVLFNGRFIVASETDELREGAAAMKREMVELLDRGQKNECQPFSATSRN